MTEPRGPIISEGVHEAAGDWLVKMQGSPNPRVERAFRKWIEADFRHRLAYEQAVRGWRESLRLAESDIGRTRKLVRAPLLMRRSTHLAAASLGLVVLLGVGSIELERLDLPFGMVTSAEAATFQTSLGVIRTFRLADGSEVTLDSDSLIRVAYSKAQRRISLVRGRARFQVAADGQRPFTVSVPGGEEVTGSRLFDVSAFDRPGMVAALEGHVEIGGATSAGADTGRSLAVGEQVSLGATAAAEPVTAAQRQWVSGMLALDATPLSDALAMINRYNRVQIRLGDSSLAALSVTGAFQSRDPVGFACAVATTFSLALDRSDPGTIVLRVSDAGNHAPG